MTSSDNLTQKEAQEAYNREAANIPEFAGKISELCKYVWAGALAIFYALVTSDPTSSAYKFLGNQRSLLFVAAIAGSLAFLFDYLQNISAYLHARLLVSWMERTDPIPREEFNRRTTSVFSWANALFFFAKNIAVLITAALVSYVILRGFMK
jgi:hypothetical protein